MYLVVSLKLTKCPGELTLTSPWCVSEEVARALVLFPAMLKNFDSDFIYLFQRLCDWLFIAFWYIAHFNYTETNKFKKHCYNQRLI